MKINIHHFATGVADRRSRLETRKSVLKCSFKFFINFVSAMFKIADCGQYYYWTDQLTADFFLLLLTKGQD